MKNLDINVEKLEKLAIPCHACCFAAGVGVGTIIVLT